ncbi:SMC-Scp complex subunit ScpB [archaeon]|nr:SMC-Scp complex subunit ScpB [archaeon]|tara:strand:+ start:12917 stop:13486 length:570 start_codon:yes stop_codon:yes gene_type:complete
MTDLNDYKKRVEAILFTTGRFLTIDELAKMCNLGSVGIVKDSIKKLKEEYDARDTSLEIIDNENSYKLNIAKDYLYLTTQLLEDSEMDKSTQETLALIAYKQPILQSDIIKMRSNVAYEHIKKLKELEFVTAEKTGRTRTLRLTSKFYDYFDVVDNELKIKMEENVKVEENQSLLKINDSKDLEDKNED